MKSKIVKVVAVLIVFAASILNGQNQLKETSKSKSENHKKCYTFKSYEEKEIRVRIAYRKLSYNLNDASYPKELLKAEKAEFVSLMKAKIVEERTT